ncbi:YccJ family protein [Orbaceae bacterium ac157xtp]
MNPCKKEAHEIKAWATLRQTSFEIAEAIFELANYDEKLAEKIWEEGSDEVLPLAFSKTDADKLFWGEQTIERKNV